MRTPPLQPFPFLPDLRTYTFALGRADLAAGLTVAVFAIPQVMAYAMLAGVPAAHGLYAAIVMSIVAALWGSSPYVNSGPTNSAALLTAAAMTPFIAGDGLLPILYTFTMLAGLIRFAMGLLRFGNLVDFVPESAFLGFTFGAGLLIALGPLHLLLNVSASPAAWFPGRVVEVLSYAPQANPLTVLIGIGTVGLMIGLRRFETKVPTALCAMFLATGFAYLVAPDSGIRLVRDLAPVPGGLPSPSLPLFDLPLVIELFPAALAVAVIGLIEAVSIGQTLALKHGQTLDVDQEFVGQGLGQMAAAFFQGFPGSGSFGRSVLTESAGARTRFANVFFGIAMLLCVLLVPGLLNLIPVSALAGLLIYIGVTLMDTRRARRVWATSRADAAVMGVTLFTTVFIKIEYGIFAGILGAALIHLNRARRLRIVELLPARDARFEEQPYDGSEPHARSDIVAVCLAGDLYYGLAARFRQQLQQIIAEQKPRFLILRIRQAYSMDYSCWSVLFDICEAFHEAGGKLYLCGVRPDFDAVIDQARMREVIPSNHIFTQETRIYQAFEACLKAANMQLGREPVLAEPWQRYFNRDAHTNQQEFSLR